jgi:hypothetical protein
MEELVETQVFFFKKLEYVIEWLKQGRPETALHSRSDYTVETGKKPAYDWCKY